MATYVFEELNSGLEVVDPTVIPDKDKINIDWGTLQVSVPVLLVTQDGTRFRKLFTNMQIEDSFIGIVPPTVNTIYQLFTYLGQQVDLDTMVANELLNYQVAP